jgi:DNA-binding transcriptional MerR regulator
VKTDESEPTLIKKKELAKRLSVSPRTIEEWTQKRIIPRIAVTARLNLYDFDEVLAVLKDRYHVGAR